MTTDTPPPPPEGWAIVPADDPRLDCLPAVPMFWNIYEWQLSTRAQGSKIDSMDRNFFNFALPIQAEAEAVPSQPPASADPKGQAGAAKPPLAMIPPEAARQAAIVHGLGAKKYKAWNWRETKVLASTYINAALRHIAEYQDRQDVEPESGQSPLAHAIASLNILLDAKKAGTLIDDRPPAPLVMDAQCPD